MPFRLSSLHLLITLLTLSHGFVMKPRSAISTFRTSRLAMTSLPAIEEMRIGDIRQELESYGISTKSFLEKKEMVEALKKARTEGRPSKQNVDSTTSTASSSSSSSSSSKSSTSTKSREARIIEEMNKANEFKVGELKKKLKDLGIPTNSFFEKSEFVKAYADAMVDGPTKGAGERVKEEVPYDSSYRDVVMQKFDPRMLRESVIDVKLAR